MSDKSKIEWTDATWNPITGCTLVSEGCRNCYAAEVAVSARLKDHPSRAGLARRNADGVAKFTGEVRFNEQWLTQPLKWKRPRRIFVCAHGDLFHESVPDDWIDQIFAVMAMCPQHVFQVLTKRPERMRDYLKPGFYSPASIARSHARLKQMVERPGRPSLEWPLPNVWLGVSVEDQETAEERIPALLETPAALRWLSMEPLLGPVDLEPWLDWGDGLHEMPDGSCWGCQNCENFGLGCDCPNDNAVYRCDVGPFGADGCPEYVIDERVVVDWVVVGGESGRYARPMHPDWARGLRDQCQAAGVPFFFKQWGEWGVLASEPGAPTPADKVGEITFAGMAAIGSSRALVDIRHAGRGAGEPGEFLGKIGKKKAGRLLDGVEHDGEPCFDCSPLSPGKPGAAAPARSLVTPGAEASRDVVSPERASCERSDTEAKGQSHAEQEENQ